MPCNFPEHHGSSGGGFNPVPALIVLGAVALASSGAVTSAVGSFIHALLITLGIVLGLAVAAVVAVVVVRVRRRRVYYYPRPVVTAARPARRAIGRRAGARAIESPRDDVPTHARIYVAPHVVTGRARRQRYPRRGGWRS